MKLGYQYLPISRVKCTVCLPDSVVDEYECSISVHLTFSVQANSDIFDFNTLEYNYMSDYPITKICGVESNATYIIRDGDECAVIDPCVEGELFINTIESLGDCKNLKLKIILTHGHEDHISAVEALMQKFTTARILIHESDVPWLFDPELNGSESDEHPIDLSDYESSIDIVQEGDVIEVGQYKYRIMNTPGHTPGSILLIDDANKVVFTGDVLFRGSIGVTHFAGGDRGEMKASLKRIFKEIPHEYTVYPGHNGSTTLERENKTNQFRVFWQRERVR